MQKRKAKRRPRRQAAVTLKGFIAIGIAGMVLLFVGQFGVLALTAAVSILYVCMLLIHLD